jgi:DeoR/GlpR family transcriptional regulator of sugar metabolism
MLTAERHRAILQLLEEKGRVTIAEIAHRFQVSTATARRDAVLLAEAGHAARSHGGLLPASFFARETTPRTAPASENPLEARLGRRGAEQVPHEGNIFIDADAACVAVGRRLLERPDLRLFTNSIALLALAADCRASLTAIGGEAKPESRALRGALAQAWLDHLRFDVAIVGATALGRDGAQTDDLGDVAVKTEVLRRSTTRILVAGAEKWNRAGGIRFAGWRGISQLVTTRELPREARIALGADKVKVILA